MVGRGETTVPADGVVLVFASGDDIDFDGIGQALSARDRQDLLDGLDALDIARDEVHITTGTYFDGEQIRVRVPLERLPDIGAEVEEVVEDVAGRLDTKGVAFTVANCAAKVGPRAASTRRSQARPRSVPLASPRAQHAAEGLAKAAKITLGELRAATELPAIPPLSTCRTTRATRRAGAGLEDLRAYDAKPEVESVLRDLHDLRHRRSRNWRTHRGRARPSVRRCRSGHGGRPALARVLHDDGREPGRSQPARHHRGAHRARHRRAATSSSTATPAPSPVPQW